MTQQNTNLNIKEIFGLTIQGEGLYTGQCAIFIRLAGCNIWNGSAETKVKSQCPYCDTDFVGGDELTVAQIIREVFSITMKVGTLIVITGGEPLLQNIEPLCAELLKEGYRVQIETNGTKNFEMEGVSVSMSPKVPADKIKLLKCDSLKILFPHPNPKIIPDNFDNPNWGTKYKSLQPIDEGDKTKDNIQFALMECYRLGGEWRVGIQVHKILGVD